MAARGSAAAWAERGSIRGGGLTGGSPPALRAHDSIRQAVAACSPATLSPSAARLLLSTRARLAGSPNPESARGFHQAPGWPREPWLQAGGMARWLEGGTALWPCPVPRHKRDPRMQYTNRKQSALAKRLPTHHHPTHRPSTALPKPLALVWRQPYWRQRAWLVEQQHGHIVVQQVVGQRVCEPCREARVDERLDDVPALKPPPTRAV